jgi:hypothetical protein
MSPRLNVFLAATLALGGCVRPAVKDLLADREKVLRDTMSPENLSPEVRAAVESEAGPSPSFSKMVVTLDSSVEQNGRVVENRGVVTLVNATKGLVERQEEWSHNDVPYRINSQLTYGGFLPLRSQAAFLNRDSSELALGVRSVKRFTPGALHPVTGKEYEYQLEYGRAGSVASWTITVTCKSGPTTPAAATHRSLSGKAVQLACQRKDEKGVVLERIDYLFLEDYGVAVDTGSSSSQAKVKMKIVDVKVTA